MKTTPAQSTPAATGTLGIGSPKLPSPAYVYKGVRYCSACGNCDCPKASADPYWAACPALGCK